MLLRISRSPSGRHLPGSGSTFRRRALLDLPGQERKVVDVDAEVAAAAVVDDVSTSGAAVVDVVADDVTTSGAAIVVNSMSESSKVAVVVASVELSST